jgi:hypothetical protein
MCASIEPLSGKPEIGRATSSAHLAGHSAGVRFSTHGGETPPLQDGAKRY